MNGRWKEGGVMIELFKTETSSKKFDRMIPSGSSWLMGSKVQRTVGQVTSTFCNRARKEDLNVEIPSITGHTGEHLLRPTAKYMKIEMTGQLPPCEICAQEKIRQANIPKKKLKQVGGPSRPGYRIFIYIFST